MIDRRPSKRERRQAKQRQRAEAELLGKLLDRARQAVQAERQDALPAAADPEAVGAEQDAPANAGGTSAEHQGFFEGRLLR